jgi:hypothetical protein
MRGNKCGWVVLMMMSVLERLRAFGNVWWVKDKVGLERSPSHLKKR